MWYSNILTVAISYFKYDDLIIILSKVYLTFSFSITPSVCVCVYGGFGRIAHYFAVNELSNIFSYITEYRTRFQMLHNPTKVPIE